MLRKKQHCNCSPALGVNRVGGPMVRPTATVHLQTMYCRRINAGPSTVNLTSTCAWWVKPTTVEHTIVFSSRKEGVSFADEAQGRRATLSVSLLTID